MIAISATGCSGKGGDPQADPKALAEAIFDAARSGNFQSLSGFIDADADGDSKRIGQVATDASVQEDFKKYFAKGKVSGDPVIDGEKASVKILFGPDGTKEETFEMVKIGGKWFLHSF
ncbi:MAG: hypothetical protein J7578_09220 [Chitinophagaceae bacterium]|nr:hypothetical protein [Chitinophagaceae bacterium]